jgi:hypothetical protein
MAARKRKPKELSDMSTKELAEEAARLVRQSGLDVQDIAGQINKLAAHFKVHVVDTAPKKRK